MTHFTVKFSPIDPLNISCGYQLTIANAFTGKTVLFTSRDPATGNDLLTPSDCLKVCSYYPK
jgi:hypothetical protein